MAIEELTDEQVITGLTELSAALLDAIEDGATIGKVDIERIWPLVNSDVADLTPSIFAALLCGMVQRETALTGRPIPEIVGRLRAAAAAGIDGIERALSEDAQDAQP